MNSSGLEREVEGRQHRVGMAYESQKLVLDQR